MLTYFTLLDDVWAGSSDYFRLSILGISSHDTHLSHSILSHRSYKCLSNLLLQLSNATKFLLVLIHRTVAPVLLLYSN